MDFGTVRSLLEKHVYTHFTQVSDKASPDARVTAQLPAGVVSGDTGVNAAAHYIDLRRGRVPCRNTVVSPSQSSLHHESQLRCNIFYS